MSARSFAAWLFLSAIYCIHRPWYAHEVARIMFDDDRYLWRVRARA